MMIELPADKPRHLIAANPIIDNLEVMHHIILYACEGMSKCVLLMYMALFV